VPPDELLNDAQVAPVPAAEARTKSPTTKT